MLGTSWSSGCRWRAGTWATEISDWADILDALPFDDGERRSIAEGFREFMPKVETLTTTMRECGVDPRIVADGKYTIGDQVQRLGRLSTHG